MDLDIAYEIVREFMDEKVEVGLPRRFVVVRAELREKGVAFLLLQCRFVRSRSFLDAIGGGSALLVDDGGGVIQVAEKVLVHAGEALHPGVL
jgi:hypothetical protein